MEPGWESSWHPPQPLALIVPYVVSTTAMLEYRLLHQHYVLFKLYNLSANNFLHLFVPDCSEPFHVRHVTDTANDGGGALGVAIANTNALTPPRGKHLITIDRDLR